MKAIKNAHLTNTPSLRNNIDERWPHFDPSIHLSNVQRSPGSMGRNSFGNLPPKTTLPLSMVFVNRRHARRMRGGIEWEFGQEDSG